MAGLRGLHQHLNCKPFMASPRNPCSFLPPPLPCWIAGHPGFAASISTSSCSRVQSRATNTDVSDASLTALKSADPSDVQQIFLNTSVHIAVPACYLMLGRQPDATQAADLVRNTANTSPVDFQYHLHQCVAQIALQSSLNRPQLSIAGGKAFRELVQHSR